MTNPTNNADLTNDWLAQVKFNKEGLVAAIAQDVATGEILMMAWMNAEALKLTAKTKTAVYYSRSRQKLWHKGETSGHTQTVHDIYLDCDGDALILKVTQQGGIACHTGRKSCFYLQLQDNLNNDIPSWQAVTPVLKDPSAIYGNSGDKNSDSNADPNLNSQPAVNKTLHIIEQLNKVLQQRKDAAPDTSYVASLYHKGLNKILEKVAEESTETILAAKDLQQILDTRSGQPPYNADNDLKEQNDLIYEIADVWFHTLVTLAWFNIDPERILAELARRFGLSGITEKQMRSK